MATLQTITDEVRKHVASVSKLANVLRYIDALDADDRDRPFTSFLLTISAFLIGEKNQSAKTGVAKNTLVEQATELGKVLGREVISADMGSLSAEHLANRLKLGYETVTFQLKEIIDIEWEEFVNHVFNHDKGYPRLINFAQTYTPLRQRTVKTVLDERLNGFSNTNIATGAADNRSPKEQLTAGWTGFNETQKAQVWMQLFSTIVQQLKLTGYNPDQFKRFVRINWGNVRGALAGIIPAADVTEALYDKKLSAIAKGLSDLSIIA